MLYPAQTSLIPIQIALARFLEQGGDIFGNYPFWYLGTTPYRYLTGPVLPTVLAALHRILPTLSLFDLFFLLITGCWLLGSLGVYLLVKELSGYTSEVINRIHLGVAGLSALFYLFGPFMPLLFRFSDGLSLISFSILPFVLLLYIRFLKNYSRREAAFLGAGITFLLLLNISIIPTLFIGMATVFLTVTGWKQAEEKLKKSLLLIAYCLLLVTLWYSPGFWLARLGVPSLAGRNLIQVLFDLGKLLPTALAIVAAFISVKFFKKRDLLRDFCFYWLFIFGFLTLMRFISDPDFWLDWSSYNLELQMGSAIAMGLIVQSSKLKVQSDSSRFKNLCTLLSSNARKLVSVASVLLIFTFVTNAFVINTLQKDISQTVEYRIGEKLSEIVEAGEHPVKSPNGDHGARVLLSGTTAFWLNVFFDIPQVRGGVDQASVDPNWRKAVWEIREGKNAEDAERWLRTLNVSYLVVHTKDSKEYYHDFTYPEKFEEAAGFEKIYEERGDRIYLVISQ